MVGELADAKEIANMLKQKHRLLVQTERGLYVIEVQHDANGVPGVVTWRYNQKVNNNDTVVHSTYAQLSKATSLALDYFYYQKYLGLKLGEFVSDKPRPPPKESPTKRVIVKRPWGIEYWNRKLAKQALAEGSLKKSDVLGAVSDIKEGDTVYTPAAYFHEHPEQNPFNKQEQKPKEPKKQPAQKHTALTPTDRPTDKINKEEYKKLLIKEVEKQLGTKIDELPVNLRNEVLDAINRKVNGEHVQIQILGITLPDLSELKIKRPKEKPNISDKIAEKAVELEYEGDQTSNVVKRLEIGAELAGLGFVAGVVNVGKGIVELGKEAVHNPIKAGKDLVTGTIGWLKSIPSKIVRGFTESPYYAGELAGEVVAGEVVAKGLDIASEPIPRPAFAKLTVLEGGGADPELGTVRYGVTIHSMEHPLLTIAKTDEGIRVGRILPAPKDAIEGKTITAYSDLETKFFEKTVEAHAKSPEHAEIFKTGYNIARKVYETNEPVTKPDKFEVLSEHIPDNAKPAVKEAIKSYKGDIEVYGSVTQKLQMEGYMSRNPKDIEIVVDKPSKFVEKLREKLDNAGIEYKIEGSENEHYTKVYFKAGDKWIKGIEIFSKKSKEGYFSIRGLFSRRSDIAYGFNRQKPIEAEGVEMLRLSEQGARKLEGGHVFKEGDIVPKHEGRWKDVNDLVEIGTAYAIEKGVPIEEDLIKYAKLQAKLHGEYVESPVLKFIAEHERLPTREEIAELLKDKVEEGGEKELLFRKEAGSPIETMSEVSSKIVRSGLFSSESPISPKLKEESSIREKSVNIKEKSSSPIIEVNSEVSSGINFEDKSSISGESSDISSAIFEESSPISPELKERLSSPIRNKRSLESSVNIIEGESSYPIETSSELSIVIGIRNKGNSNKLKKKGLKINLRGIPTHTSSFKISLSSLGISSSIRVGSSISPISSVFSEIPIDIEISESPKPKPKGNSRKKKNDFISTGKIRKDEWNIFNKYNDPLKVGNKIVNEVNKLLGGDILRL